MDPWGKGVSVSPYCPRLSSSVSPPVAIFPPLPGRWERPYPESSFLLRAGGSFFPRSCFRRGSLSERNFQVTRLNAFCQTRSICVGNGECSTELRYRRPQLWHSSPQFLVRFPRAVSYWSWEVARGPWLTDLFNPRRWQGQCSTEVFKSITGEGKGTQPRILRRPLYPGMALILTPLDTINRLKNPQACIAIKSKPCFGTKPRIY